MNATLTANRRQLSSALSRITRTAKRNSHRRTAITVARISVNGDVRILATDLETAHAEIVDCEHSGEAEICVYADMLAKSVRSSKAKQLTLTIDDDGITVGSSTIPSALPIDEALDVNADRLGGYYWEGRAEVFTRIIESVIYACDTDSTQYALSGVKIELSDKLLAVATDGRKLSVAWDWGNLPDDTESDNIVPKRFLETVLKACKAHKNSDIRVEVGDDRFYVEITVDGRVAAKLSTRLIEGRFPKWRDVIPSTDEMSSCHINPDDIVDAIKACKAIDDRTSRGVDLTFNFADSDLSLSYSTDNGSLFELIPMEPDNAGEFDSVTLDWTFLRDSIRDTRITFHGKDADNAVLLESSDCLAVIMPINKK